MSEEKIITTQIRLAKHPGYEKVRSRRFVVLKDGKLFYLSKPGYYTYDKEFIPRLHGENGFVVIEESVVREEQRGFFVEGCWYFPRCDRKGYYVEVDTYNGDWDTHYEEVARVGEALRKEGLLAGSECRITIIKEC